MKNESTIIYNLLSSDAELGSVVGSRIYADGAPRSTNPANPYMIYSLSFGQAQPDTDTESFFETLMLTCRVYARSRVAVSTALDAIDKVLFQSDQITTDGTTFDSACMVDTDIVIEDTLSDNGDSVYSGTMIHELIFERNL